MNQETNYHIAPNSTETEQPMYAIKCKCALCKKMGCMRTNSHKIKTTTLCILILKTLKEMKPEKDFFSMKQDIYGFVNEHKACLAGFSLFAKPNWKKMLLDTFNHCTKIETGKGYGLRASFRLKEGFENQKSEASETTNDSSNVYETPSAFKVSCVKKQIIFNDHFVFDQFGVFEIKQKCCEETPQKK